MSAELIIEQSPVTRFLELSGAESVLGTEEYRREFLHSMDYVSFRDLLIRFNGIARNVSPVDRRLGDESYVYSEWKNEENGEENFHTLYFPPLLKDREPLLKEAFDATKQMDDLESIGFMLGLTINAIHPFNDGNGRTGRLTYMAIAKGYRGFNDNRDYNAVLQNNLGRQIIYIGTNDSRIEEQFVKGIIEDIQEDCSNTDVPRGIAGGHRSNNFMHHTTVMCGEGVGIRQRDTISHILQDITGVPAIIKYAIENLPSWQECVNESEYLDMDKLLPTLSQEEVSAMIEEFGAIKKQFVRAVIAVFSDPSQRDSPLLRVIRYPYSSREVEEKLGRVTLL